MAADVPGATAKHDPDAPDVEGDEYDPKYDNDRSGDHNKAENEKRQQDQTTAEANAKKDTDSPPGMTIDEISGKPIPINK